MQDGKTAHSLRFVWLLPSEMGLFTCCLLARRSCRSEHRRCIMGLEVQSYEPLCQTKYEVTLVVILLTLHIGAVTWLHGRHFFWGKRLEQGTQTLTLILHYSISQSTSVMFWTVWRFRLTERRLADLHRGHATLTYVSSRLMNIV